MRECPKCSFRNPDSAKNCIRCRFLLTRFYDEQPAADTGPVREGQEPTDVSSGESEYLDTPPSWLSDVPEPPAPDLNADFEKRSYYEVGGYRAGGVPGSVPHGPPPSDAHAIMMGRDGYEPSTKGKKKKKKIKGLPEHGGEPMAGTRAGADAKTGKTASRKPVAGKPRAKPAAGPQQAAPVGFSGPEGVQPTPMERPQIEPPRIEPPGMERQSIESRPEAIPAAARAPDAPYATEPGPIEVSESMTTRAEAPATPDVTSAIPLEVKPPEIPEKAVGQPAEATPAPRKPEVEPPAGPGAEVPLKSVVTPTTDSLPDAPEPMAPRQLTAPASPPASDPRKPGRLPAAPVVHQDDTSPSAAEEPRTAEVEKPRTARTRRAPDAHRPVVVESHDARVQIPPVMETGQTRRVPTAEAAWPAVADQPSDLVDSAGLEGKEEVRRATPPPLEAPRVPPQRPREPAVKPAAEPGMTAEKARPVSEMEATRPVEEKPVERTGTPTPGPYPTEATAPAPQPRVYAAPPTPSSVLEEKRVEEHRPVIEKPAVQKPVIEGINASQQRDELVVEREEPTPTPAPRSTDKKKKRSRVSRSPKPDVDGDIPRILPGSGVPLDD